MLRSLYPDIAPARAELLDVGGGHRLWFEECGAPGGVPVLFLHGGPGSCCKAYHRQFFDATRYRIILFDQRGCGRSQPRGGLEANTTAHLLDDIERLRRHLGIERWLLFAGSWGATLALLHAQRHPASVAGMVLRGTFLARPRDIEWFFGSGANRLFPDAWAQVLEAIPDGERGDLLEAYYRRIVQGAGEARARAAQAWARWSGVVVTAGLDSAPANVSAEAHGAVSASLLNDTAIELHYARHGYFIEPNAILDAAGSLPRVPMHIVHGRRDLTCPVESSWSLHRAAPHSSLEILPQSGHLANDPHMIDALVRATDRLADRLETGS